MDKRIQIFTEYFSNWEIELTDDIVAALNEGQVVQIVNSGWTIKILFAEDEESKYMDFYAAHRMTNDRHHRVRVDGSLDWLPAFNIGMRVISEDPEEDARLEKEYREHDQNVMKMLNKKGFGITGTEHTSFLVQKFQAGVISDKE